MSNFIPEIEKRKSKRALSSKVIHREIIERLMTAATWAPSCFNNQPWRFVVVHEEPFLKGVKAALSQGNYWAQPAPLIIAVCTKVDLGCRSSEGRDSAFFDTGLAVENLILQAFKEGLIAHAIAGYTPSVVRKVLSIPEDYTILTLVIAGFPGDPALLNEKHRQAETGERQRLPQGKVVMYNKWNQTTP